LERTRHKRRGSINARRGAPLNITLECTPDMTITPAAEEVIRQWLNSTKMRNPVVRLMQMSDTPPELDEAARRGAPREELKEIAGRTLVSQPKYLYPGIYPRMHFLWIFTTKIGGFRFASPLVLPPAAREAMKTGTLDVAERGLVLRDAHGIVVLPTQANHAL
jgi:hypothetical protein